MARIRTIKPEFWIDPTLIECSLSARLLFVGTWNFADDYGNLEAHPLRIKAQIFPMDDIQVEPLIAELVDHGLLVAYEADGKNYLHIKSFQRHQKINRPSQPQCPPFEPSVSTHGTLSEPSVSTHGGKGREGKGRDKRTAPPAAGSPSVKLEQADDDNNEKILELKAIIQKVHSRLPEFNTAQFINHTSKRKDGVLYPPEVFIRIFSALYESDEIKDPWAFCAYQFEIQSQNVQEERMRKKSSAEEWISVGDLIPKGLRQ